MVLLVALFYLAVVLIIGTVVGAFVGIRRDVGRIADVLEKTYERDSRGATH